MSEIAMKVLKEYDKNGHHFIEKTGEKIVGETKKVIKNVVEETWREKPGFYNDGMGGTNVRILTTDEVRDAFSDLFLGKRIETKHMLTEINYNGAVSTPEKPLLIGKEVDREAANGHRVITTYGYGTGYKISKKDNTLPKTVYFSQNGVSPYFK